MRRMRRKRRIQWPSQNRKIREREHQPRDLSTAAVWISWIYFCVLIVV